MVCAARAALVLNEVQAIARWAGANIIVSCGCAVQ